MNSFPQSSDLLSRLLYIGIIALFIELTITLITCENLSIIKISLLLPRRDKIQKNITPYINTVPLRAWKIIGQE